MHSVGERLRRERVRQGIELAQLARDTRINLNYLQAIEAGTPDKIPGGFFYRSFVRQYALALAMNAQELEAELERAREEEAPVLNAALKSAQFPIKEPDPIVVATNRRMARGRLGACFLLLVGVVAGCSAFYSWWHRIETRTETVQSAAGQAVPAAPTVTLQTAAAEGQPAAAPQAVSVDISHPDADDRVVLSVAAREKTWVSITSDGKQIFSGTVQPGQTKVLGGREKAQVRVGNAGGLEITWNGKPIGPIGQRGQVRTVLFTPENFRILSAADGSL